MINRINTHDITISSAAGEAATTTRQISSHFKVIKSKKSTKQKVKKWLINHIHPKKRLPVMKWLPNYKLEYLKGDIISGLTVGMVVIPQSLAIAGVFGCSPVIGLYSSFVGPFSSFFFSTSPDNSVGPTLLVALLGSRYNPYASNVYLSMMSFFSGLVMILMSLFNAGVLMNLVSFTVLSAFIVCGCIAICVSQLPGWFGIVIEKSGQMNGYQLIYQFFANIGGTNYQDFLVGLACVVYLLFCHYTMPYVTRRHKNAKSICAKVIWEIIWMIYVAKNALMTVVMTLIVYLISKYRPASTKITIVGHLPAGFPIPWSPIQSAEIINANGKKTKISAMEIISNIYPSFFLAPVMMFIETLSIAKNFSKQKDYYVDATQELLNIGIANVVNSFFRGYPIGGALARSTVNSISGVKTCLSGLISIFVVILTLIVLTPAFYYTPKPTLAGMLVAAVIPSIKLGEVRTLWRVQKIEILPWVCTILIGFYRLELGMAMGLVISSGFILFREMRPKLHRIHHIHRDRGSYSVRLRSALHYPCAVFITTRIKAFQRRFPELSELEIDCHAMHEIDITVARELLYIVEKFKNEKEINVRFTYVKKGSVRHIMTAVGLGPYICDGAIIAAEDCKHCHSYHNHSNFQSVDLLKSTNIRNNMDTTRSAPIHTGNQLHVVTEIPNEELCSTGEHTPTTTEKVVVQSHEPLDSHQTTTHVCLPKSINYSIDVEEAAKHIHSSNTESSSSSSGTDDSDISNLNPPRHRSPGDGSHSPGDGKAG